MHVVHYLSGGTPFGGDWASAANTMTGVRVTRLRAGRHAGPGEVASGRNFRLRPLESFYRVNDVIGGTQIARAVRRIGKRTGDDVDILHGHFAAASRALSLAALKTGGALVITEHSSAMTGDAAPHKQISEGRVARARTVYERADAVVAVSTYLARGIGEKTGIKAEVIPNPVDVDLFRPGSPADGALHVVFVGRLEADKRPEMALHGFKAARRERQMRLTMIGDGPDRESVVGLVRDLGLEKDVTLTGKVGRLEVARLVASAHIGLSTSRVETFGVVVAEFGAAGLPVVAPEREPFNEVLAEQGRVLFDPGSVPALAAALLEAGERQWDAESIRQSIVDRYAPEVVGKRLAELYTRVLAARG